MQSLFIKDFRYGLDVRKSELTQRPGTLEELTNGYINQGGEIQNRKAFVRTARVAGTFGLQPTASGLYTFGSLDLSASHPVNIGTVGIPINVNYQRLQHPAVLYSSVLYDASKHDMDQVIFSSEFRGKAFVVAKFTDRTRYCYYDGTLVNDSVAGKVLAYLAGHNDRIADHMKGQVDSLDNYSAAKVGPYATTQRAHAALVVTLTIGAHGFLVGDKVWVSGIVTAGYNVDGAAITAISATTISYTTAVNLNEVTTAEIGGTVTSALINVDGDVGVDYTLTADNTTDFGTMVGPTNTVSAVVPVTGKAAVGSFTITGGSDNGVAAAQGTANIVRGASNATAGTYVQIGKKKYTFRTTLSAEGDVLIGAAALDSQTNLMNAINHGTGSGTTYIAALAHPLARAGAISGNDLPITSFAGSQAVALSTNVATWSASATTLAGGAGNCVSSVKVVSPTGSEVELLPLSGSFPVPVRFSSNVQTTAALVRDSIAANVGVSGYTATVNENTVTILSSASASPMPNGYHVQVATGGDVLIGECMFYLTQLATSFSIATIQVDGLDCLGGAEAFPSPPIDTLAEFYTELVSVMNSRSGITGINSWTNGEYVKMSRLSTRDDDQPLAVYVTPTSPSLNQVGVVFGEPPALVLPLKVTLPTESIVASSAGLASGIGSNAPTILANGLATFVHTLAAKTEGGNGAFTYEWLAEYPELASGVFRTMVNVSGTVNNNLSTPYTISMSPTTGRGINITMSVGTPTGFNLPPSATFTIDILPVKVSFPVRVRVTDSAGNKSLSDPCNVLFEIV